MSESTTAAGTMEEAFLQSLREEPDHPALRLVYADWLDEQDDPRGELLRLTHTLTQVLHFPNRGAVEARVRALLTAGVPPVGPCWTNSVGIRLAWVPPGTFLMGSPPDQPGRQDDETLHPVTLSRGYYLSVHPVTQAQWRAVLDDNPSRFLGDDRPVEGVSWHDCQRFCRALTLKDGLGDEQPYPYRLPTEAEWEYACRAGTSSAYFFGDTLSRNRATFHASPISETVAGEGTSPVGRFPGNAWGLTDLHGNIFEWCADSYAPYPDGSCRDPLANDHPEIRVLRGGSWHSLARRCRSAARGWGPPNYQGSDVGCRLCFRLPSDYSL